MNIEAKQEFKITFSSDEMDTLLRIVGDAHQYRVDMANEIHERAENVKDDYHTKLANSHRSTAEEYLKFLKQLPKPYNSNQP